MSPERIEQERKAFEAWMAELYPTNPQTERVGDEYSRLGTQYKWEGWQAKATQSEWISVEDRLPENNTYVLAVTSHGLVISDRVCDYGRGKEWVSGHSDNPITHWQLLPAPPTTNPAA